MRNNSRKYKRRISVSQEWKKVVRFNNRDYLLKSVYDTDSDNLDDSEFNRMSDLEQPVQKIMTGTVLDELPWQQRFPKPIRVDEDFFNDFADEIIQAQDEVSASEEVAGSSYPMEDINGNIHEIEYSDDGIKNAVFFLLNNIMVIDKWEDFHSVDDFLVKYGVMNDINSYRIKIADIIQYYGQFRFIPEHNLSRKYKGQMRIYFTEDRNAMFAIDYPDIKLGRPRDEVAIDYAELCDILSVDRITLVPKKAPDYYRYCIGKVLNRFIDYGAGITVLKRTQMVPYNILGNTTDASIIMKNFNVVSKISKKNGTDASKLYEALDYDMSFIEACYKGVKGAQTPNSSDEFFVLIGASETLFEYLINSPWMKHIKIFGNNWTHIHFVTPDPKYPVKKIPHNMLLIPMADFALASPGLALLSKK